MIASVGLVVIGRNEGERLARCLGSIDQSSTVVYVDSGSTDASVELARSRNAYVVELDKTTPFTAARARNAGFHQLRVLNRNVDYIQFVDGDTELHPGWIAAAKVFLDANPRVGVVSGRLRERHPSKSIYNLLCDMEWDRPAGEADACGGNAMMRVAALDQVGGFREALIAGEEPELCFRLRRVGWQVWRLNCEMGMHDADLATFFGWWRRAYRGGHAFAEGAYLHGAEPERHFIIEARRAWFWGFWFPALVLAASVAMGSTATLLLAVYPLQIVRIAWRGHRSPRENWWQALFIVLAKFPEALGQLRFLMRRWARLIAAATN